MSVIDADELDELRDEAALVPSLEAKVKRLQATIDQQKADIARLRDLVAMVREAARLFHWPVGASIRSSLDWRG